MDSDDDFQRAVRLEQLGDAAAAHSLPAAEFYREAQGLLLPAGVVWNDREAYARRMEAFERIQQKVYGLDGSGRPHNPSPPCAQPSNAQLAIPAAPNAVTAPLASPVEGLSVWQFHPGLEIRVVQTFQDYDGQEVRAGELLHFVGSSYFFYDGGHTLRFAEKTIRLADVVEEHQLIIANTGNAWFQPLRGSGPGLAGWDVKANQKV